jgi:hypothetical protein
VPTLVGFQIIEDLIAAESNADSVMNRVGTDVFDMVGFDSAAGSFDFTGSVCLWPLED